MPDEAREAPALSEALRNLARPGPFLRFVAAGTTLWLVLDRLFALIELGSVSGRVSGLDRANLTILQVKPLETLLAAGLAAVALFMAPAGKQRLARATAWAASGLCLLLLAAGAVVLYQGATTGGLAQVAIRAETGGAGKLALTLRLALTDLAPGAVGLIAAGAALVAGRPRRAAPQD